MEFIWMRTKSVPSLTRAAVKGTGSQGQLLFSLGVAFNLGLYCWFSAVLLWNYNCSWFASLTMTVTLWFDFPACLQIWLFTAVLLGEHWTVSDLIPVSRPGPNPDLLLSTAAPRWCRHCSLLPCYHAQLPVYLLTLSCQTTLTSLGYFFFCALNPLKRCINFSNSFASWKHPKKIFNLHISVGGS